MARRSCSRVWPALAVQDVLLQQREERLHGGVVAAGPDAAHRAGQAVAAQSVRTKAADRNWLPRSECTTTVPAGERSAMALRSAETARPGGHPGVHRVADDPVGVDVLDRAEVELALAGGVLGDVGQPGPVRAGRGELAGDQVIVDRRPGFAGQAAFLR